MLQCLQDLITQIQQKWIQYGILVSQDVSFYPAVDETPDKSTGIVGRVVLKLKQVNCIIPVNPYCLDGQYTAQFLEVNYSSCHNFQLGLYEDSGFTIPANAECNYIVSGTAYGDMGTVYTSTRTIQSGQHQINFNLNPYLQPGECVDSFEVHSVDTSACLCPVIVDFSPYI